MAEKSANNPSASAHHDTLSVAMRLLRICGRGEGRAIAVGLALLLLGAAAALLQPWPMKLVIDSVIGNGQASAFLSGTAEAISRNHPRIALLVVLCVGQLLLHVVIGGLTVASTYVLVAVGLRMVFKLRCALFEKIQRLSLRFHDNTSVGDSIYRVAWDSYAIQAIFNSGMIPGLTAVLTLLGIGTLLAMRDWLVALAGLAVCLPLALLVRRLDRPMSESSMMVHERESQITAHVQEAISGIRTVLQTASQSIVGLLLALATALLIGISAYRVLQGRLSTGDVVLTVAYVTMLFRPLETLANTAAYIQGAVAGARRVLAILDTTPDVADTSGAIKLTARARGEIELQAVSFGYRAAQVALDNVSLHIPAGMTIALVGPSGAGKTTLVSLLMRFYDPSAGKILLDGRDIRGITLASLRQNISLVLQEPVLFGSTIAENIAYGLGGASLEQIEAAAKAAGAHEFIIELPQRYDTKLGERGVSLSGGQRQRISIARAFLKDAPVLIMDEPTSALDSKTEAQLLETLEKLKRARTTIIIAHRLSTIRSVDRIAVMSRGRIVETGTHQELLAAGSHYANLYHLQYGTSLTRAP